MGAPESKEIAFTVFRFFCANGKTKRIAESQITWRSGSITVSHMIGSKPQDPVFNSQLLAEHQKNCTAENHAIVLSRETHDTPPQHLLNELF